MDTQPPVVETKRRPYVPPRLTVHGSAAELTGSIPPGIGAGTSDIA
jgi:hypothetical protein